MIKTILALSACLMLTSAAASAHGTDTHSQFFDESSEESIIESTLVADESLEESVEDILAVSESQENEIILAGCPGCPRNPKSNGRA